MKFFDREVDEGLYIYAAVSAAVLTSVFVFYNFVWKRQQQAVPATMSLTHEDIQTLKEIARERNSINMLREP